MAKRHRGWQHRAIQPTLWDLVNWDLPNQVIEELHGIDECRISTARQRRRHPPRWDGRTNPYGDMELLAALQAELTKKKRRSNPPPSVRRLILRIKCPITRTSSIWRSRAAAVDWTKRDFEIARVLGCSRERVRQVRRILGKPPSSQMQRKEQAKARELAAQRVIEAVRNAPTDAILTIASLSQQTGVSEERVAAICRDNNLDLRRFRKVPRKYEYQQINWDLPNFALRRIYPHLEKSVARARQEHGRRAKWDGRGMDRSCPEFLEACRKEQEKAGQMARSRGMKTKMQRSCCSSLGPQILSFSR